jgi:hypothetical protein
MSIRTHPSGTARIPAPGVHRSTPSDRGTDVTAHSRGRRTWGALAAGLLLIAALAGVTARATGAADGAGSDAAHWVNGWQGSPTAGGAFNHASCPADTGLADQTVRNVVPVSTGGGQVRVRLSNAFGNAPLQVGSASIAPPAPVQPPLPARCAR